MNRLILFMALGFATGCVSFAKGSNSNLMEGDIVFHKSTSNQSTAIELATRSPYTHVGVITMMLILAIGTSAVDGHWLIAVAATGFWLSDISVANGRFKNAGFLNRLWGIPLYFVAQLVFAATTIGP